MPTDNPHEKSNILLHLIKTSLFQANFLEKTCRCLSHHYTCIISLRTGKKYGYSKNCFPLTVCQFMTLLLRSYFSEKSCANSSILKLPFPNFFCGRKVRSGLNTSIKACISLKMFLWNFFLSVSSLIYFSTIFMNSSWLILTRRVLLFYRQFWPFSEFSPHFSLSQLTCFTTLRLGLHWPYFYLSLFEGEIFVV